MTPWLQDADVTLYHGDALAVLRELPAQSFDSCVTSPPYWGLRDYGSEGQLGLEPTLEEYVARLMEVFREVRRVLADHGTVWLNLGDSYANSPRGNAPGDLSTSSLTNPERQDAVPRPTRSLDGAKIGPIPSLAAFKEATGLKQKDLVGIPWRVAFAMQADGWYLRSDIIWAKPNPMPESVTDRPTKAHEYVFLLSKNPRYFFDQEAVREPHSPDGRHKTVHDHLTDYSHPNYDNVGNGNERWPNGGRNIRSVWEIATQPYPEAHFATFPEELARRCIAAGCPEQVCRVCGKVRERIVDVSYGKSPAHGKGSIVGSRGVTRRDKTHLGAGMSNKESIGGSPRVAKIVDTLGFTDCGHGDYRPGTVLDPFIGSGTVAHVARKLGRHAVGIDLSEDYLKLAARRLQQQSLFAEVAS